ITALALQTLAELPDATTRRFARCALLSAGQWALDGRRAGVTASSFRERTQATIHQMIQGLAEYAQSLDSCAPIRPALARIAAEEVHKSSSFGGRKAHLVVTSPPYPGIHIL